MGWKKLFVGEKMPDKNDPKYKQRYESEVNAGRKFARMMKLDVLARTLPTTTGNCFLSLFSDLLYSVYV